MFNTKVKKSDVKEALYWITRGLDYSEEERDRARLIERMIDYDTSTADDDYVTVDEDVFKFLRIN